MYLETFFSIPAQHITALQSLTSYPQVFEGIADIDFLTPKHSSCFPTHPSPIPTSSRATFFREDIRRRRLHYKRFFADLASFQINQDVLRYGSTTLMNLSWDLMIDWLDQLARSMGRF